MVVREGLNPLVDLSLVAMRLQGRQFFVYSGSIVFLLYAAFPDVCAQLMSSIYLRLCLLWLLLVTESKS